MNKFQLYLETSDPELFRKATSELGTTFYHIVKGDGVKQPFIYEIAYFSGSRVAKFIGQPTKEVLNLCKVNGYEVEEIDLDEFTGTLKVKQKKV